MFAFLAFLVSTPLSQLDEQLAGQLRQAIWHDLQVNAMIGNGNWLGSLWYNVGSDNGSTENLHIRDLACRSAASGLECTFTLFRDGGPRSTMGETAPDTLACHATFREIESGSEWAVRHLPPRKVGHSQTTMKCDQSPS